MSQNPALRFRYVLEQQLARYTNMQVAFAHSQTIRTFLDDSVNPSPLISFTPSLHPFWPNKELG